MADDQAGIKQRCPHCQGKVLVPDQVPVRPVGGPLIEFLCPSCRTALRVPADQAGETTRCTSCQAKVQIPEVELRALLGTTIEFLCPRCHASIQARGEHAGVKQFCPQCGGKLRVPVPAEPPGALSPEPKGAPAAAEPANTPDPLVAIAVESSDDLPITSGAMGRFNLVGWLIPVFCLALIIGVGAWLMQKPPVKLEGTLAGERLTDIEFGPFPIDAAILARSRRKAQDVIEYLELTPIRAGSQFLSLEFRGSSSSIGVTIRTTDGSEFFRVDPTQNQRLARYLEEQQDEYKNARQTDLTRAVPEFLDAIEKRGEGQRELAGLAEFRDSVGLAALVGGFGHQVHAVIGRNSYPCVHEDPVGRLFFALPRGTREFEIVGRPKAPRAPKDAPAFPGRYQVHVATEPVTVNKEAEDPKQKLRDLMKKRFGGKQSD